MNRKHDTEHNTGRQDEKKPGFGWTVRITGPIRYRRYTDKDGGGRPSIFFKFELAPGQSDLPQEVYDILHELKYLNRNPEHGKGSGQYPTGLEFQRSRKHGRVWKLPDDSTGRTAADIIDAKLSDLAHKMEQEQGKTR
jgi:hypothetical protein